MTNGGKRPGAGKPKGSRNKRTMEAIALAEKLNVSPLEILLYFASEDWEALGYTDRFRKRATPSGEIYHTFVIEPEARIQAAKDACKYLHPQLKAVELTGKDGQDLFASWNDLVKNALDAKRRNGS